MIYKIDQTTADIITALIAALVSFLVAYFTTKSQNKLKINELEQKQLKDILAKRMEAYPQLWYILQTNISNWKMEGKITNGEWAANLYMEINKCHAKYGVFFSEPVYHAFFNLRSKAHEVFIKYHKKEEIIPHNVIQELDDIWSKQGLATELKNDLGSYINIIISKH